MEIAIAGIAGLVVGLVVGVLVARRRSSEPRLEPEAVTRELAFVRDGVERLGELVRRTGGEGQASFGELSAVLRSVDERTSTLTSALGNSRVRGQWGERAAEDILRTAGLTEGAGYHKQRHLNGSGSRPDFTFPLPNGLCVHMDVKFPLENHANAVEATSGPERERYEKAFVRDTRDRVKELGGRQYIDPANGTVDYVLLFIPSESVYAEVNRLDRDVVDYALSQRVILCSPLTLFGVLAVIRKSVESFAFQQASDDVLRVMARFEQEWRRWNESLEILGKRLDSARSAYNELSGTRTRKLQEPLAQIALLRRERGLTGLDHTSAASPANVPNGDAEGEQSLMAWERDER